MRRVLLTGAGGMLARDLHHAFGDVEVVALTRAELDITDAAAVTAAVDAIRPDVLLNTAAWTDVDGCEGDPARAKLVNATGAHHLAVACARTGATLVTYSTDHVFDGTPPPLASGPVAATDPVAATGRPGTDAGPRGYREEDPVGPVNAYGRSKVRGEELVRAAAERHLIIRTAWLAGARGRSFVATMLRLGREGAPVRVVDDQTGCPTFARDLAAATRRLVDQDRTGTVHVVNDGRCTWFDLAAATFAQAGMSVDLAPQPSSALDRPAARPAWSVLDTARARAWDLAPLPAWEDGLARLLAELGVRGPRP